MSNGSEGIAEYPGRPDYTALIARVRDYYTCADALHRDLADAVEALVDTRDTLVEEMREAQILVEGSWVSVKELATRLGSAMRENRRLLAEREEWETVGALAWVASHQAEVKALRGQLASAEAVIEKVTTTLQTPLDRSKVQDTHQGRALWQSVLATEARKTLTEYRSEGGDRG